MVYWVQYIILNGSEVYLISLIGLTSYNPTESEFSKMYFGRGYKRKYRLYQRVHMKYQEVLNEVSQNTKTPIIDFSNVIKDVEDRKIFYDIMHTNLLGAQIYGDYLTELLLPKLNTLFLHKNNKRDGHIF